MNLDILNIIHDNRVNGLSISATTTVAEYLEWFNRFGMDNKLDEQRPVMKTRSANMIRKRLVEDLKAGAVIPPIVMGIALDTELKEVTPENAIQIINEHISEATVIDGMQRTEALKEAFEGNHMISSNSLRIDIWITRDAISLIYRMLVLNTGQTPWDVKRQLEVIHKPLIDECRNRIQGIVINVKNDNKRRTKAGVYQASSIVELFLAFSSRKELVNTSDKLADDFTRLDVTEMASIPENAHIFYECIKMLYQFDVALSRYAGNQDDKVDGDKFYDGMDIFTNMPAKIGFIVALAQLIMGRAGTEKSKDVKEAALVKISSKFTKILEKINGLTDDALVDFISIPVLNEAVRSLSIKKIGNEQRKFFLAGFEAMFKCEDDFQDMNVVWRAY